MKNALLFGVLFLSCFLIANATKGGDVSQYTSVNAWSCLKNSYGYQFAIVRCYQSLGKVDPNCAANIANARAAGIPYVDAYMFPCPTCGNPEGQMNDLVNYLHNNNVNFGMIWLDIEGPEYWYSSCGANLNFITGLVNTAKSRGIHLGIYSSYYQWQSIACMNTAFSSYDMWYAHYDNNPSFSDWVSFGGWTRPAIKQYAGDLSLCGVGVDANFY